MYVNVFIDIFCIIKLKNNIPFLQIIRFFQDAGR